MKNLKTYLIVSIIFITSITMLIVSCSKDEGIHETESVVFQQKSLTIGRGDKIAEIDTNGNYVFTVSKDSLLADFNKSFITENYKFQDLRIVMVEVDDDPNDIEYLLVAESPTYKVKAATSITLKSVSFHLIGNLSSDYRISCTSNCEFGCNPTILRNPAGQKELTCMRCSDGKKCTKITTYTR